MGGDIYRSAWKDTRMQLYKLRVMATATDDHEEAAYSAVTSLEEVVAWFVEDGFTDGDILDRVEDAMQMARDDLNDDA